MTWFGEWQKNRFVKIYDMFDHPFKSIPYWNGEDLSNKALLIWNERGLGDTIGTSKFIPKLKVDYPTCKLITAVQRPLMSLFEYQDYVDEVIDIGTSESPKADFRIWGLELYNDEYANDVDPWLSVPDKIIRLDRPAIGISWTGSHIDKSVNKTKLAKILHPLNKMNFYSLQFPDYDFEIVDFLDLAAVTNKMDLILTVDSSLSHLAGALGKEVFVMGEFHPEFWYRQDQWYKAITFMKLEEIVTRLRHRFPEYNSLNYVAGMYWKVNV